MQEKYNQKKQNQNTNPSKQKKRRKSTQISQIDLSQNTSNTTKQRQRSNSVMLKDAKKVLGIFLRPQVTEAYDSLMGTNDKKGELNDNVIKQYEANIKKNELNKEKIKDAIVEAVNNQGTSYGPDIIKKVVKNVLANFSPIKTTKNVKRRKINLDKDVSNVIESAISSLNKSIVGTQQKEIAELKKELKKAQKHASNKRRSSVSLSEVNRNQNNLVQNNTEMGNQAEVKKLQEQIKYLKTENKDLVSGFKEQFIKYQNEQNKEFSILRENHEEELKKREEELEVYKSHMGIDIHRLQQNETELKGGNKELNEALQQLQNQVSEVNDVNQNNIELEEQIDSFKTNQKELQRNVKALSKELNEVKKAKENLYILSNKTKNALNVQEKKYEALVTDKNNLVYEFENINNGLRNEFQNINNGLRNEFQNALHDKDLAITSLQESLVDKENEIEELQNSKIPENNNAVNQAPPHTDVLPNNLGIMEEELDDGFDDFINRLEELGITFEKGFSWDTLKGKINNTKDKEIKKLQESKKQLEVQNKLLDNNDKTNKEALKKQRFEYEKNLNAKEKEIENVKKLELELQSIKSIQKAKDNEVERYEELLEKQTNLHINQQQEYENNLQNKDNEIEDLKKLESENNSLKSIQQKQETEIENYKKFLDEEKKLRIEEKEKYEREYDKDLNEKTELLKNEKDDRKKEVDTLKNEIEQFKSDISVLEDKISIYENDETALNLNLELEDRKEEIRQLKDKIAEYQIIEQQLKSSQNEQKALVANISDLNTNISHLQNQLQLAEKAKNDALFSDNQAKALKKHLDALETEFNKLNSSKYELEIDNNNLKQNLSEGWNQIDALTKEKNILAENNNYYQDQLKFEQRKNASIQLPNSLQNNPNQISLAVELQSPKLKTDVANDYNQSNDYVPVYAYPNDLILAVEEFVGASDQDLPFEDLEKALKDKIESYKKGLTSLHNQVQAQKKWINKAKPAIEKLSDQSTKKDKEIKELKNALKTQSELSKKAVKHAVKLTKQNEIYKKGLKSKDDIMQEVQNSYESSLKENGLKNEEALKRQKLAYEQKLKEQQLQHNNRLSTLNDLYKQGLKNKEKELGEKYKLALENEKQLLSKKYDNKINELNNKINNLNNEKDLALASKSEFDKTTKELESQRTKLEQKHANELKKLANSHKEQMDEVLKERAIESKVLLKNKRNLKKEIKEIENLNSHLVGNYEKLLKELSKLRQDFEKNQDKLKKYEEDRSKNFDEEDFVVEKHSDEENRSKNFENEQIDKTADFESEKISISREVYGNVTGNSIVLKAMYVKAKGDHKDKELVLTNHFLGGKQSNVANKADRDLNKAAQKAIAEAITNGDLSKISDEDMGNGVKKYTNLVRMADKDGNEKFEPQGSIIETNSSEGILITVEGNFSGTVSVPRLNENGDEIKEEEDVIEFEDGKAISVSPATAGTSQLAKTNLLGFQNEAAQYVKNHIDVYKKDITKIIKDNSIIERVVERGKLGQVLPKAQKPKNKGNRMIFK